MWVPGELQICGTLHALVALWRNTISSKIITEESTVPAKTAKALERVVNSNTGCHSCWILSNPEFLAKGTALRDRSNPRRVLIGGPTTH